MPPFAPTDGICVLSRREIAQYPPIHNSRNHPKVPETRRCAGCRLWSSMSGVGPKLMSNRPLPSSALTSTADITHEGCEVRKVP
jgi:hypothetical protein